MDDSQVASKLQAVAAELEAGCREHPNEDGGTLPADDFIALVDQLTGGEFHMSSCCEGRC